MSDEKNAPLLILKTERLMLRRLQPTDDQQIFALRSNQSVNRYLDRTPNTSVEDAQKFIHTILENHSLYWAITLTGVNKLIGAICLFNLSDDQQKAEIGYELLPEFQGKGIMQEAIPLVIDFAFRSLNINAIEAYTLRENLSSIKILEKLKFEKSFSVEDVIILYTLVYKG